MDPSDEESDDEQINLGTYEGERNSDDERHGVGKANLPNGDVYEGQYSRGHRHGEGTYTFASGALYVGNYVRGRKEGYGEFRYPDGSRYEGNWSNDLKNGTGVFYYVNGDRYEGGWLNNNRHGQGTYYYNGGPIYEGEWENGAWHGAGEYVSMDHRYIGSYHKGLPTGDGKYMFNKGYEQHGFYIVEEVGKINKQAEGEGNEDDSEDVIKKVQWKPTQLQAICISNS